MNNLGMRVAEAMDGVSWQQIFITALTILGSWLVATRTGKSADKATEASVRVQEKISENTTQTEFANQLATRLGKVEANLERQIAQTMQLQDRLNATQDELRIEKFTLSSAIRYISTLVREMRAQGIEPDPPPPLLRDRLNH